MLLSASVLLQSIQDPIIMSHNHLKVPTSADGISNSLRNLRRLRDNAGRNSKLEENNRKKMDGRWLGEARMPQDRPNLAWYWCGGLQKSYVIALVSEYTYLLLEL